MDREISKRKIDLLKSIMSDPKLSKTLTEALKSPIGSTKRDQARSVFSILKKTSGNRDGKGGLFSQTINYTKDQGTTQSSTPAYKPPVDYSNMVVFQPVSFKNLEQPVTPKKIDFSSGIPSDIKLDTTNFDPNNISTPLSKAGTANIQYPEGFKSNVKDLKIDSTVLKDYNPKTIEKKVWKEVPGFSGGYYVKEQVPNPNYKNLNDLYPNLSKTSPTPVVADTTKDSPVVEDNVMVEEALQNRPTVGGQSETPIVSGVGEKTTSTDPTIAEAQSYVDSATGPLTYAKKKADELYEGGLQAKIERDDAELKEKLGFTQYETQLNNMEANKGALIPTITSYIRGRDEYLTAIDQMIENTEMSLMNQDMSNPAVADSYNNYLKYLYTLKGRQTQRYGNYLNSAVEEYNADFDRLDSQFDSVKTEFDRLSGQNYEITMDEYNNTLAAAADLYTNLQEEPTRRMEKEVLENQLTLQQLEIIDAINAEANTTDPDYMKKLDKYTKFLKDENGNLNFNNIGPGGLAEAITRVDLEGEEGNKTAFIDALKGVIKSTISNAEAGEFADATTLLNIKKLVDDLEKIEGGSVYTEDINPIFEKQEEVVKKYLLQNISSVKDALNNLVSKKGALGKNIETEEEKNQREAEWFNNYSSLGTNILSALYKTVESSATEDGGPQKVVQLMLNGTDLQIASNLAKDVNNVKN